jgi:TP901 family phage tail tape measure protein
MPIKIPTVQTGLEASIQAAAKKAGRNLKINMGGNAKSIEGLSQPLGRITGKADQFTKSMEAANARVLAFGASVGILSAVTRGFQNLIKVTIDVEKSLTSINSILNVSTQQLESFKNTIFDVARNTEQSFSTVAQAALELSRQGLKAEEVTSRLNDALILSRLSGLGASEAVAGLTAAINSFNKAGLSSSEVLNKLSAAAVSAAVSEKDLIEGIKRSGSVATQAGVSFDELVGVITAVQAKTARGGAVIGNSFKTIFTRIQSIDKLKTMQNLGVEVTDASGQVLGATKLIQNLAKSLEDVPDARKLQIAEGLVGKFQVAPFLAILDDYISKTSRAIAITEVSQNATSQAYDRNEAQNATLSAAINRTTQSVAQFAEALGKIGITDNLKSLLGFFSSVVEDITNLFDGDSIGSKFAKGIVAGIGNIITGPGLAIAAAIIGKLAIDLVRFGVGSLQTFFGLNKAAQQQATLQGQIASTLLGNSTIQKQILAIENSTLSVEQKRAAQTAFFTTALNEQLLVMTRMQSIASRIAPGVLRGTGRGRGRSAGGFIPNYNAIVGYGSEKSDISKGVGGAPASAKPVTIPNFNFGGGQKGTMVANSSEYIVPNYAGGDGSAVFNQDMAASIGLPSGARKIGAAGGYIPNFVNEEQSLVMFAGDRGGDEKRVFHVGKDKAKRTKAYASKPKGKGILTTPVTVPIYRLRAGKGDVEPQDIQNIRNKLSKSSTNTAKNFAKNLSGKTNLPNITEKKIESLFNPGAFEGMSGSIFEVALGSILASRQFLDYSSRNSNSRIDLPYDNKLFSKFGAKGKGQRGSEVKATGSLASGAAEKFYDILVGGQQVAGYKKKTFLGKMMRKSRFDKLYPQGIGPRNLKYNAVQSASGGTVTRGGINDLRNSFAGGYIPNFANPLQDAIGREQAAGLPVNQIRVNQSPKLRNAGNPMGLAVTNTRDEPTGAIPNFAKPPAPDAMGGGIIMTLMAVQMGFSMLQGQLSQTEGEGKKLQGAFTALNLAITGMMLGSAFGGLKGIMGFLTAQSGKNVVKGSSMMSRGSGRMMAGRATISAAGRRGAVGMAAKGGLSTLQGGLMKAGGALLRFAGPVGAAVAVVYGLNKLWQSLDGTSDNLKNSQIRLADSAQKAATQLAGLKIEDKEEFKKDNRDFAQQFIDERMKRGVQGGAATEQIENLKKQIIVTLDSGATNAMISAQFDKADKSAAARDAPVDERLVAMREKLRTEASQDEGFNLWRAIKDSITSAPVTTAGGIGSIGAKPLTARDSLRTFSNDTMDTLNKDIAALADTDFIGIQEKFIEGITETQKLALAGKLTPKENAKGRQEVIDRARGTTPRPEGFVGEMPPAVKGLTASALKGALIDAEKLGDDVSKNIDKVKIDTAKVQLSMEIELMKLRAQALTFDEKTLALAKRNNSLGKVGIIQLQHKIALSKEDVTINSSLADLIKSQVNKDGSEIVLDQTEITAVAKAFAEADLGDLSKQKDRDALFKQTLITLGKSEDSIKASKGLVDSQVLSVLKLGKQKKINLGYSQDQEVLDAKSAEHINNISKALATASFRKTTENTVDIGDDQRELDRDKQSFSINNPFVSAVGAAKAEKDFVDRQSAINIEEKDNQVVEETKATLLGLIDTMPNLGHEIKNVIGSIEGIKDIGKAFGFLDKVAGLKTNDTKPTELPFSKFFPDTSGVPPFLAKLEPPTVTTGAKLDVNEAKAKLERLGKEKEALAGDEKLKGDMAGKGVIMAGAFKMYSQLLTEFTDNLRGEAESLKLTLLTVKDGASAISNIDDQLFKKAAQAGGAGVTARASDAQALSGATDKITLARTSVERRAAIKNRDILAKELEIKTKIAVKQEDGITKEKDLVALRGQLIELEKQRLAIGTSRAELFENEFKFTAEEIQEGLDKALVQNARTFVDTISDGLVDAIAKGEDLGDVLKQAASNFFLGEAKSNMSAAFKNITSSGALGKIFGRASGGPVTGGSGSKDDVPALLMGGEFVMRKSAVQKYGSNFMDSLNSGKTPAMARGGLFTPGTYGQEEMRGKNNLLNFATQSFTTGASDRFGSGSGFASVGLEPQSAALTMFGRRNSPAFQREQASKQKAFELFTRQAEKEKTAKERSSGFGDALKDSLLAFGASFGFKKLTDVFGKKSPTADILMNKNDPTQYDNGYTFTATGGAIPNAAGVDTVPSMLSGGEFVMNAAATQKIGRGNLNALNSGAGGGSGDVVSKLDELISVSDNAGETVINITVNSDGSSDSQGNGDDQQTSLATKIKDVVKQVIDDEKRLGGSLRQARA